MSICPLYTGLNYMHYSLMGEMRLPLIDSDLLYRGDRKDRFNCNQLVVPQSRFKRLYSQGWFTLSPIQ